MSLQKERRAAEERADAQQGMCDAIRAFITHFPKGRGDVCETGYHRMLGNWTSWDIATAEALVFLRHLKPGQEEVAIRCHLQLAKSAKDQIEKNGWCHMELPQLCLDIKRYLEAAGWYFCPTRADWVNLAEADGRPRKAGAA